MTDQKQEARTLTLGERIVQAAKLAVEEHLRQSVTEVPFEESYFGLTDFREDLLEAPATATAVVARRVVARMDFAFTDEVGAP